MTTPRYVGVTAIKALGWPAALTQLWPPCAPAYVRQLIPPAGTRRRIARPLDAAGNRIDRLLGRLKQFRRLATRYDKTASGYRGLVQFVCAML